MLGSFDQLSRGFGNNVFPLESDLQIRSEIVAEYIGHREEVSCSVLHTSLRDNPGHSSGRPWTSNLYNVRTRKRVAFAYTDKHPRARLYFTEIWRSVLVHVCPPKSTRVHFLRFADAPDRNISLFVSALLSDRLWGRENRLRDSDIDK